MSELVLQVQHLSKSFGSHEILRDIDFSVHAGDVTSIIGASGSGKSTLLRGINLQGGIPTPRPIAPRWAWCFSPSICSTT